MVLEVTKGKSIFILTPHNKGNDVATMSFLAGFFSKLLYASNDYFIEAFSHKTPNCPHSAPLLYRQHSIVQNKFI